MIHISSIADDDVYGWQRGEWYNKDSMEEQPAAQPSRPEQLRRYVPSDPASRLFWLGILTRQRGDAPLPKDWMRDAACSPATSEEYFSGKPEDTALALRCCIGCAVIDVCAAYAVREGVSGICAGLTAQQRRQLTDGPTPADLPSQSTTLTSAMHHAVHANDTPRARIAWAEQCMAERRHIGPQAFARLALCIDAETKQQIEPEQREDCAGCPVAAECLLFALRGYQRIIAAGDVRGGTTQADRRQWGTPKPKQRRARRR
ncbi:WhiB family transcriptional regulator [Candidatus Saccharibacteria bacterium]|nr:WhiB family transcriptional regulator [Candidatus Saccharibacteria bacterium]